jgi:hypothetical protein
VVDPIDGSQPFPPHPASPGLAVSPQGDADIRGARTDRETTVSAVSTQGGIGPVWRRVSKEPCHEPTELGSPGESPCRLMIALLMLEPFPGASKRQSNRATGAVRRPNRGRAGSADRPIASEHI